jgi:hypothetical protein
MWHDLPINTAPKQALNTPGASARQYALTFDPMVHMPIGRKLGVYAIGGIGAGITARVKLRCLVLL